MSLSNYTENAFMNWLKGSTFPAAPAAVYVGLFSNDPGEANTGTEVTTTIRAAGRVAVSLGALGDGSVSNDAVVDFGSSDGAATVSHVGLFDAASAGNLIASGPLDSTQSITEDNLVSFPIGTLTFSIL